MQRGWVSYVHFLTYIFSQIKKLNMAAVTFENSKISSIKIDLRFLSGMNSHMQLKAVWSSKRLCAFQATVWFLSSTDFWMPLNSKTYLFK